MNRLPSNRCSPSSSFLSVFIRVHPWLKINSFWSLAFALALGAISAKAQSSLPIYTDRLVNGFDDWSWASHSLANTSPVHSGARSISVTAGVWEAISLQHPDYNSSPYANFTFWANGGASGGQRLQVAANFGDGSSGPVYPLTALPANAWQQFTVPLSAIGAANKSNLSRLNIQLTSSGTSGTFYLDDAQLTARPAPALVNVSVNATQAIRSVDARLFGVNTAIWDGDFGDTSNERLQTTSLLNEMGTTTLRFPGGSLSDEYHWASGTSLTNIWQWNTTFAEFVRVATNIAAQVFITVNYGTGTPAEAAAWVRHSNVTNNYAFKYWEIGNENYGSWETDTNAFPHDPYTYAVRAKDYIQQMKAADATIKIGVVAVVGENSYSNLYSLNHPATNPRTGQTNYGWTPIMLATLTSLGVTPDFVVHHVYPEFTDRESDPLLLQSAVNWALDAADLRQQITDYFGAGGTNIELVTTENNSNSGIQGRQSTSLVNGLYYADSLGQIMKTEFNAFVWWDLRNGTDFNGSFDTTLYGWRNYGDLGMINGLTNRHPPFYAAKLAKSFARAGDTVLNATSDYLLLSAYAVRRAGGAVTVLIINKDTITNLNAKISVNGFTPGATATLRSYGIPQDEAARTNAVFSMQDIATNIFNGAGTNFPYNFAPLSLTLFTLTPNAPSLAVAASQSDGQFVFQLQGQPDVRYVIQASTNLAAWVSVATNTLTGSSLNVTNPASAAAQFWRAVWLP